MYKKKPQDWMKHLDFIALDLLCLVVAFFSAYAVRFGVERWNPREYTNLILILLLVDFVVLVISSSMRGVMYRGWYIEFTVTVKHTLLVTMLCLFYLFAVKGSEVYSRLFFVYLMAFYLALSYCARQLWKSSVRRTPERSKAAIFLITTQDRAEDVLTRYREREDKQYLLKGLCLLDADGAGETIQDMTVTCNPGELLQHLCREWVDEVLISVPTEFGFPNDLINALAEMGIVIHMEMQLESELNWGYQQVEKLAGRTVLTVGMKMATPLQLLLKRLLDVVGGIVGCLITGLLTIVIGPMIYLQSPGPIFFSQTRVGKNGKRFQMYKFRSMYLDAEERKAELMAQNRVGGGLMFKLDFDPRIIGSRRLPDGTVKKGIGNFIRDWSLDEFPQFWNVLKGDLSLVGTRPPTVDEWDRYELHHRARLATKPGITGMWQVSGRSKITDFEQVVALDKKYIQEWSMGLDLRILLQTVLVVLRREGSM